MPESYLDFLAQAILPGFAAKRARAPQTGMPMPSPNPLRLPDPTPQSLLGELLTLPVTTPEEMQKRRKNDPYGKGGVENALTLPAVTAEDQQRNKQGQAREDQARTSYQNSAKNLKEQDKLPSVERPEGEDDPEDEAAQLANETADAAVPTKGPGGDVRVPVPQMGQVADPFKAALLQAGLALMTPQWGNGLSQIGQAAGQGIAAAGRAHQLNDQEQRRAEGETDRTLKREATQADIDKTKAETEEIKSGESSRSRRLRGKNPTVLDEAAAAAGLGAKGKAYLQQRLKSLNQEDLFNEDADAVAKFNDIIAEAKRVDAPTASPAAPASTPVTPAKEPNIGGTEQATNLPLVKTPEDARKLPPGTRFLYEQDGKLLPGRTPK